MRFHNWRNIMYWKNTAGQNMGFALIDASTGDPVTGATVTAKRSINGGSQASVTGSVSELGDGQYNLALSQADTNGDNISFMFWATDAVPVEKTVTTSVAGFSSGNFQDPRKFLRGLCASSVLAVIPETPAIVAATSASFFTESAKRGIADDTNWTANTYKTILSTSGSGIVHSLVGPTGLAGTPTTEWEFTVDGVLYPTVSVVATTTGQRAYLGATQPADGGSITFGIQAVGDVGINAAKDTIRDGGGGTYSYLPGWRFVRLFNVPCLEWTQSILVRARTTENNSTTTNQERQTSIQYMTFS
jgi:hypothetical protein